MDGFVRQRDFEIAAQDCVCSFGLEPEQCTSAVSGVLESRI
jgi:hypothetical protein